MIRTHIKTLNRFNPGNSPKTIRPESLLTDSNRRNDTQPCDDDAMPLRGVGSWEFGVRSIYQNFILHFVYRSLILISPFLKLRTHYSELNFLKTRQALLPPKAKEFESAIWTSC